MKYEDIKVKDIVKFKTKLLNEEVEDIGVVKKIAKDEYWNENFIEVIPFNLKVSSLLLKPSKIKKKIGAWSNFGISDDEDYHQFNIGYKFRLKLSEEFFKKYIEEIGYAYWKTSDEMKKSFDGIDSLEFTINRYEGMHMNYAVSDMHDLRITDKFIREFSI